MNEPTVEIQGLTYKIGRHGLPFVQSVDGEWRRTTREAKEIRKAIFHIIWHSIWPGTSHLRRK